jgi:hypothetical protein
VEVFHAFRRRPFRRGNRGPSRSVHSPMRCRSRSVAVLAGDGRAESKADVRSPSLLTGQVGSASSRRAVRNNRRSSTAPRPDVFRSFSVLRNRAHKPREVLR